MHVRSSTNAQIPSTNPFFVSSSFTTSSLSRLTTAPLRAFSRVRRVSRPGVPLTRRRRRVPACVMKRCHTEMMAFPDNHPRNSDSPAVGHPLTEQLNTNLETPQIPLTFLEKKLFDLLLDVANQDDPPVTLRVAGGWVRDKILSPEKDLGTNVDIDIALDSMLGIDFAERVKKYLSVHDNTNASVGVIQKNPDQSKHLETATMKVHGVALDFVNLRTETYTHDSRIPNIRIGTPLEDAMRRDLTINALFYNINKGIVEDFTGKAFDDIRARIVRTPLTPLETLLDDPLRAMRAIRFASRLNFDFDPQLFDACKDERVHEALGAKVSRERISAEVDRVLHSNNAVHAVGLLVELGIFPIVFRLPQNEDLVGDIPPPKNLPDLSLGALGILDSLDTPASSDRRLARYAAIMLPLAEFKCMFAESKKRKVAPVSKYIMRSQLRLGCKDVQYVCELLESALELRALVHRDVDSLSRKEVGFALRTAGAKWRSSLQLALVMELKHPPREGTYAKGLRRAPHAKSNSCEAWVEKYKRFEQFVDSLNLDGVWDYRPLINGNELMKVLPKMQKGPIMGSIMKEQICWQIENPGKDKVDLESWISKEYPFLR